jgi:hypothetical protein
MQIDKQAGIEQTCNDFKHFVGEPVPRQAAARIALSCGQTEPL